MNPKWRVEVGEPGDLPGWIRGSDLSRATDGPFHELLERICDRLRTTDKRTVAASFSLRFGWCASVAIAPYLVRHTVLNVSLANIALRFRDDTLFDRAALLSPEGTMFGDAPSSHALVRYESEQKILLRLLRGELQRQTTPVVEALFQWSGFSRKGAWGMVTSSWASQFINISGRLSEQIAAIPVLRDFFAGDDEICRMQPRLHPISVRGVTHVFQRRASCCRYYLLPRGDLCASCPLVSDEDRLRQNREWMEEQLR